MEILYLANNNKIISNRIYDLFIKMNEQIISINRELAAHDIDKKYTNIMIDVNYKMNEAKNIFTQHDMIPEDSVTYYTFVTQLIRIAESANMYLDKFIHICNKKFGQRIYEYNRAKYLILSKILLDKYQSYKEVINNLDVINTLGISAYDFLDLETNFDSDYSDITISFTCTMIKEELEELNLSDQIPMIEDIEEQLQQEFKKNKKQLKKN